MTHAVRPGALAGPCAITGAGRGIGRALAEHLAARRAPLALCARSNADLEALKPHLLNLGSPSVEIAVVDVGDDDAVRAWADDVEQELGPVYGLVNNAAVLGPVGRVDDVDTARWRDALVTNVVGVANTIAAFAPQFALRGRGRVINLSGGGVGGPNMATNVSAYTASKAAVAALTETLALELRPIGVTVNAVAPGPQPTSFVDEILAAGPQRAGDALYDATRRQCADAPDLESFFGIVEFLLSDKSAWLTGRLLSARWDSVQSLEAHRDALERGSSRFALRRIDEALYRESARDGDL